MQFGIENWIIAATNTFRSARKIITIGPTVPVVRTEEKSPANARPRMVLKATIIRDSPRHTRSQSNATEAEKPIVRLLDRIVSGGQTGVDRAALDAAIALRIAHGGWCPLGRIAEDGPIGSEYHLQEHPSPKYSDRTKRNVLDSDGTLVLYRTVLEGGSLKTSRFAANFSKPCITVRLTHPGRIERVRDWMAANQVRTLNIAGPRASKEPEIYRMAFEYLIKLLG